ncbi:ABC transporter permease [Acholeplasma hippikon]|uniref:ABC-type uncharacterized transport system, permease component n=1 Tax=Acholeplasma hippikon TaxID=264636 RepID=A0A449BI40_9MOLU|nr:ABC-2 family transporter protein [Acholeplasma hippikon]VEU82102.1 ABC-type uncharacterized transport system, permease component [Acholeplasma hippikon]
MNYLRLYRYYFAKSVKARLSYRLDAVIGILGFLITNAILFSTLYLTISSIPSLNGWNINHLGFLYGFYLIPKSIDHMLSDNIWQMGTGGITNGMFDKYLVRPVNALFQMIAETVQLEGLGEFILGVVLLAIFTPQAGIIWNFETILTVIMTSIFGMILFFSIKLMFGSMAFWTKRSIQIMSMVYNVSDFSRYPVEIFGNVIKSILLYVVPFSLVLFRPIEAIIKGENVLFSLLGSAIGSIVFLLAALLVYREGLKKYESAGS